MQRVVNVAAEHYEISDLIRQQIESYEKKVEVSETGSVITVGDGRRTRPLGRKAFETLAARYEARRRADGLLPATYDLILLILRKAP